MLARNKCGISTDYNCTICVASLTSDDGGDGYAPEGNKGKGMVRMAVATDDRRMEDLSASLQTTSPVTPNLKWAFSR